MARGLPARPFPIFLSGGLDTKTDPRLVPAGSLLEVENMFYQRTGELRLRNGFATLPSASLIPEICGLWGDAKGLPVLVGKTITNAAFNQLTERRFILGSSIGAPPQVGWQNANQTVTPETGFPHVTCERITGVSGEAGITSTVAPAPVDGDVASDGTIDIQTWLDISTPTNQQTTAVRRTDVIYRNLVGTSSRPPVACSGGSGRVCAFGASGNDIAFRTFTLTNNPLVGTTISAGLLDSAAPWIDVKPVPGGSNIVVAYKLTAAGGVGLRIIDPTSGATVVGPVAIAGADASQCLGLLNDSLATGNGYLITAGSASGVVVRTFSLATLAVTVTVVIDATATANVRNVTGHVVLSATNYVAIWDVLGTPANLSKVVVCTSNAGFAGAVITISGGVTLYSKSFLGSDGRYYLLTSYSSPSAQDTLVLFYGSPNSSTSTLPCQTPVCVVFPGSSSGPRAQCSLTSAYLDSSNRAVLSAGRKTPDGSTFQERIAFTMGGPIQTRELGRTVFSSGGAITADDGSDIRWATFPFFPEPIVAVSTAGGSMSAGKTYSYVAVRAINNAVGDRTRSAKSIPVSVTLAAGHGSATLTIEDTKVLTKQRITAPIEIYRAGPAEDGDTGYNKVAEVYSAGAPTTIVYVDTMSDAAAENGEELYSTGNVLENFATPSTRLMEVCNQRLWIASAETTDELWPSKQYKPGTGVNFNPLLSFRVTGDGYGAVTALAAMGSTLIVFKSGAIYAISGDGPNELGQGSFNQPQDVSRSIGTTLPASVVATPQGVMFQSQKGIWMVPLGGGAPTFIGAPVEQYTLSANVVGSSLVTGTTQVRFVMADGRCLVYDYSKPTATLPGSWTTFLLRVQGSTVVACADIPSGWCYACADGRVYQETPNVFSDVNSVSTIAIVPAVTLPILAVGGINGFARLYAVDVLGEYVGDHTLSASLTTDYDLVPVVRTKVITAATGAWQLQLKPTSQKGTAYRLRLTSAHAAGSGAFRLSAVTLWAGMKRGSFISDTKRIP